MIKIFCDRRDITISPLGLDKIGWEIKTYLYNNYHNGNIDGVSYNLTRFTEYHPDRDDHRAADWLFVLNTLNFALWNPKGSKQWTVNKLTGYLALCAAIKRAIDKNIPIWNPNYYAQLSKCDLEITLKSDDGKTTIPLLDKRLEILHQVGKVLIENYEGTFVKCLLLCKRNPHFLRNTVVNKFESYEDKVIYKYKDNKDKEVSSHNKVEHLLSDIWFCFKGHEFGLDFNEKQMISTLMFEHRIFQIFLHFKIIICNEPLMAKIENNESLKHGSKEELEIRSCLLYGVEKLNEMVKMFCNDFEKKHNIKKGINYLCIINNFLWDYRQVHDELLMKTYPFPNVQCVYF